ncbi:MAG: 30S ribosomal protein S9 [Nanoarchaeota archaeon]|nr:30S ribosomal protein S9 [Nanoarchaeota archaeon]MBU4455960.1 30S ribosomal protein S9 [Nanoarchaeota archaeon]MCG2720315.1 30S ribosomal protein S9 [Nanoarchaeota archaeon]
MKIIHTSGTRKQSRARATLKVGTGIIRINKQLLESLQPKLARMKIMEPLLLAGDIVKKINIDITTLGGGWSSQADAVRLALARGLVEFSGNKNLKKEFLEYDRHLLVADVRRNEPHKPNDSKPRAARQKSYR